MIAPMSKTKSLIFKFFSIVIIAAFSVAIIAIPCFASVSTDDSGNWSPSSYYVAWYIYDTDTGEYNNVNVTSSLTVDGLTFTFPYNTTGVTRVQMFLYSGLSSNVYIDGISFDGYISYEGSTSTSPGLVSLTSTSRFSRYYYSGEDLLHTTSTFDSDNPFSFLESYDTLVPFNRCLITFYPNVVSGYLSITFSSFILGGQDISTQIVVQNLSNAEDTLSDLGDKLVMPTPDSEAIFDAADEYISGSLDSIPDGSMDWLSNDFMIRMLSLVVVFATLSYILFGKKA